MTEAEIQALIDKANEQRAKQSEAQAIALINNIAQQMDWLESQHNYNKQQAEQNIKNCRDQLSKLVAPRKLDAKDILG